MSTLSESDISRVRAVLEKKTSGEMILLDWNAFDAAGALTQIQVKDIHQRLIPDLEYAAVYAELLLAIKKKRAAILAAAKDMCWVRMLDEAQRLGIHLSNKVAVSSKDTLRAYFKESDDPDHTAVFKQVTHTAFVESPRWQQDMCNDLKDLFGIGYDPETVILHDNGKGNGFLEKICTKANNNARQDLYAAQGRASVGLGKVDRIKRRSEDAYENDKYIRINSVKHRSKMALDTDALMVSHPCPLDDQNIST